jgi:hypothetical protein
MIAARMKKEAMTEEVLARPGVFSTYSGSELAKQQKYLRNRYAEQDAIQICEVLNARWNVPYITVLPETVLYTILNRLSVKEAISCSLVCKSLRASMLAAVNWKPKTACSSSGETTNHSS